MVTTEQMPIQQTRRPAWGFSQAFILQSLIILWAFVLQALKPGASFPGTAAPWNWVIALSLILLAILMGAAFRKAAWMRWLSGAGFAIANVTIVAVISLFGTIIVQDASIHDKLARLGLHTLFTSIPFAVAIMFMMLNLSLVIGRRFMSPGPGFLGFMLNHVGLLLVLLAAFPGKAQYIEAYAQLPEGYSTDKAWDAKDQPHSLGASITLNKFEMDKYPPSLFIGEYDAKGQEVRRSTATQWPSNGLQFQAYGIQVKVLQYLPLAMPDMSKSDTDWNKWDWQPSSEHGLPAAKVEVTPATGKAITGWIVPRLSSGMMNFPGIEIGADEKYAVGLLEPMVPKEFRSFLTISEKGRKPVDVVLKVNQPVKVGGRLLFGKFRIGGWHLYQSSYQMGMSGRMSIIEAVNDPALPLVYTGLVCMMVGAIIAFWLTPRRRKNGELNMDSEEASAQ